MSERNTFGNNVFIGSDVKIGIGNFIGNNCVIHNGVEIGNNNYFGDGCVIGGNSNHQLRKKSNYSRTGENEFRLSIGNNNLIGEYVTVHLPVMEKTIIGDEINIGSKTHIAHDCIIENRSIISINCGMGGYVRVLEGANIGIGVNIHPRLVIGQFSMIGLGTIVINHIHPFVTVAGNPQRFIKVNDVGLKRQGFSIEEITYIQNSTASGVSGSSERIDQFMKKFNSFIDMPYTRKTAVISN